MKADKPAARLTVEEQFVVEGLRHLSLDHERALQNARKPRFRFRDAITGLFVRLVWAKAHPDTTVRERVK